MDSSEMAELDETVITSESRSFAADLFARLPELRTRAAMERLSGEDCWTLVVKVSAPSGDPRSELVVWVDGGDDPSVAFGDWHTHETSGVLALKVGQSVKCSSTWLQVSSPIDS